MFDIGFSELLLIAVVALVVLGPERLPKVARTLGHLFGRMQRYVADVKAEINREMEMEEVRNLQTQFKDAAQSMQKAFTEQTARVEAEVHQTEQTIRAIGEDAKAVPPTDSPHGSESPAAEPQEPPSPQLELGLTGERETAVHQEKKA